MDYRKLIVMCSMLVAMSAMAGVKAARAEEPQPAVAKVYTDDEHAVEIEAFLRKYMDEPRLLLGHRGRNEAGLLKLTITLPNGTVCYGAADTVAYTIEMPFRCIGAGI
jgi:hypothetical protein